MKNAHREMPESRESSEEARRDQLAEAILTYDNELDRLLREALRLAEGLKSRSADAQVLRDVLRRAVQCEVRQTILDGEMRSLALTDPLTGLHNRRGFVALGEQQLKLAIRNMQGVLLFFCDVDHLKEINDDYGHEEGDRAVVRAAQSLRETFRYSDIIGRLGGDEFGVLAFEAASESQEGILRRLAENIKTLSADETRYSLSLSIGISRFDPETPLLLEELMSRADRAMYQKKRNRSKAAALGAPH